MKKAKFLIALCIFFAVLASALNAQQPTCLSCQKSFPCDYKYCPYCGRELQKRTDVPIVNPVGMKLKYIPPGEFLMGSSGSEKGQDDDELPQHLVKLTKGFYIGVTEVTQGQWIKVMKNRPWSEQTSVKEADSYPATYVSWDDAVEFCKKLGEKERRIYRLPTEAEWEYACRAGTKTAYSCGDDDDALHEYAWFRSNTYDAGEKYAHPVAQKKPNPWGLYDMPGNVWEWCTDFYHSGSYPASQVTDPKGSPTGERHVIRGGAWNFIAGDCRSAERGAAEPDSRNTCVGFRVLLEPSGR